MRSLSYDLFAQVTDNFSESIAILSLLLVLFLSPFSPFVQIINSFSPSLLQSSLFPHATGPPSPTNQSPGRASRPSVERNVGAKPREKTTARSAAAVTAKKEAKEGDERCSDFKNQSRR